MAPNKNRLIALDWAKLIAIFAIFFLHTVESEFLAKLKLACHFGVPFFASVSVYFSFIGGSKCKGWGEVWRSGMQRFRRLYTIFLIWNLLVLLLRSVNSLFVSKVAFSFDFDGVFFSGLGNALWFLPFLCVVNGLSGLLGFCTKIWGRIANSFVLLALAVCIVLCLLWLPFNPGAELYVLHISQKAWLSVLLAWLFALLKFKFCLTFSLEGRLGLISSIVFSFAMFGLYFWGRTGFFFETLAGVSFAGIFICAKVLEKLPPLNPLFPIFVYVAHAPIMQTSKDLLRYVGFSWPADNALLELVFFGGLSVLIGISFYVLNRYFKKATNFVLTGSVKK